MSAALADDLEELRAALAAQAEDLCLALLGKPAARSGSEWRWGKRGSLSVVTRGSKRGLWHDHEAGTGGDLFDLIRRERGGSFAEAVAFARDFVRMPAAARPAPKRPISNRAKITEADPNDAARLARARRYAAEAGPIAGTVAERYLIETRRIPKPAAGWPDALRFHHRRNALVVVATDAAGEVRGVQLVHLAADGTKRPEEPGRPTKQSFGLMDGAAVHLPGEGGPLLLAEGPETGLSVWAATGRETWIALGSVGKLAPPPLRRLVVCADDDPRDAPAAKSLRKAIGEWRAEGRDVAVALPWARRRFDKSDFNDLIRRDGAAAVLARIRAALAPPPPATKRLPVELARHRLAVAIEGFFAEARSFDAASAEEPPIVHGIRVGVGIGKSDRARREAARYLAELRTRGDQRTIAIAVPTHKLADEQARAFEALPEAKAAGLRAAIWRGREADDPDAPGETMCRNLEAVRDALAVGADVESSACRRAKASPPVQCPFFGACAYQAQKHRTADLWLVPHELLFAEKPKALGELAAVIVDEAAWADGLEGVEGRPVDLTLDAFDGAVTVPDDHSGLDTERLRFVHGLVGRALAAQPDGPLRRDAMLDAGLTRETAGDGRVLSWRRVVDPGLLPGMSVGERRALVRAAAGNRTAMRLARFFKALGALLADDAPEASGWISLATVDTDDGPVRVVRLRGRREVRKGWRVPTLILDALLDPALVRPYWPQIQVTAEIEATTPHMRVRQLVGRDWPKTALVPDEHSPPAENERRLKNSERVRAAVLREARAAAPGRVLVVVQKAVEDYWRQFGPLPANVDLAHHNAVAGRDGWRDVRKLIVVGRTLPRPGDVERMAEALTGRAVTARASGRYERHDTAIEMQDGTAASAEADRHPDPIAEAIRWQICEGELIQIIGRGRAVNRTAAAPLEVLVLTDRPLPLPVDESVTWEALAPGPADLMLAQGGVALADAADAARAYPSLWPSPAAARQAFHRAERAGRCVTIPIGESSIGECHAPLRRVDYQRVGPGRRPAVALFAPEAVPDIRVWLEERLGPLARCDVEEPPAPPAEAAPDLPAEDLDSLPPQGGLPPGMLLPVLASAEPPMLVPDLVVAIARPDRPRLLVAATAAGAIITAATLRAPAPLVTPAARPPPAMPAGAVVQARAAAAWRASPIPTPGVLHRHDG